MNYKVASILAPLALVLSYAYYNTSKQNKIEYTYGELTEDGFNKLFYKYDFTNKIFYDLGSGKGKLVKYAASKNAKKAIGIEYMDDRYKIAVSSMSTLPKNIQNRMVYYNGDFFKYPIRDADIIFISNLCLSDSTNSKLTKKIEKETKPGTIIVTSKKLVSKKIKEVERMKVQTTWNSDSEVIIQIKIN